MNNGSFPTFALVCLLAFGCSQEIGDECASASECVSTETDRLCLTEAIEHFPGGYCTQFNCAPDTCPEEAVCIGYRTTLASSEACSDPLEPSRLQRNYCMRTCDSDGDCRSGYSCLDLSSDNPWGARVLEEGSRSKSKICGLPYSAESEPERASDVCSWSQPPVPSAVDAGAPSNASSSADAASPVSVDAAVAVTADAAVAVTADAAVAVTADAAAPLSDAASTVDSDAADSAALDSGTLMSVDSSVDSDAGSSSATLASDAAAAGDAASR